MLKKLIVPVLAASACTFMADSPAMAQVAPTGQVASASYISLSGTATSATMKFAAHYKESLTGDSLSQRLRVEVTMPPLTSAVVTAGGKVVGRVSSDARGFAAIELGYEGTVRSPGLLRLKHGSIVQVGTLEVKLAAN